MNAGHAYELPADDSGTAVADALAEVEAGQIAYLTRAGQPVAALVSLPELVELQHAANTAAITEAEVIRARPGPRIPHEVLEAMMAAHDSTHDEMAAALDALADQELPPDEVTALWKRVSTRRG
jgi:antitoxin (DNA-binding transcriptional repressor) of toxin-antitoxin stability system